MTTPTKLRTGDEVIVIAGKDLGKKGTLRKIIKTKNKKFIVINMIGGHGSIPKSFNKFKPNSLLKKYPLSFKNKSIFINDYDNMIFLQDYVLSKIIKSTKHENLSSINNNLICHICQKLLKLLYSQILFRST